VPSRGHPLRDRASDEGPLRRGGGGSSITRTNLHAKSENPHSNGQNERAIDDARPEHGCTLKEYSEEKQLPEEFLRGLDLRDVTYFEKPAVRIPYPSEAGQEAAVRFRVSLHSTEKFRWRSGNQPLPYGLRLLDEARAAGFVVLVEGEHDCHTLWFTRYRLQASPARATGAMGGHPTWKASRK